jgi:alpha-galactosidase
MDVARICPKALVLNFTNPESRVCMGISQLTEARALGLCHGVIGARHRLADAILKRPLEEIDAVAGGLNHFFWFMKIADKKTGKDLYPLVRKRILKDPSLVPPLVRKMVEIFGCYTYPSDDHIGEYVSFAHEFTGLKWHYGQECRRVPRQSTIQEDWLKPYLQGKKPVDERLAGVTEEVAIPIIAAKERNRRSWIAAVNVLNTGNFVSNLPSDAVVEVPALVDGQGVKPQKIGALPEALAAFCRTQVSIQKLIIEAYRTRSKTLLLQALLLDPVVHHVGNAERLLDDMLALQSDYLPTFR